MTETGDYLIYTFDRYGRRLKDLTETATSMLQARAIGDLLIKDHKVAKSFIVSRVLFNSLDEEG